MSVKLLIADDEDVIRTGVAKYVKLHTDKFEKIYEAKDGQEAIDIILKHRPDIILLDVQMPLKNGIDVMQEADRAGLHPVIIILSGYDEFKYAQQAIKYGAKEYLLKPTRASDILTCLHGYADEIIGEKTVVEEDANSNNFVEQAKEYIAEHYAENLNLSDIAKKIGISSGYLSSMFSQYLNCGFIDYVNQVRVERACGYLEQNYMKVYEIAYRVGFKDEKYFSKVFKKFKGVSPKEYKTTKR